MGVLAGRGAEKRRGVRGGRRGLEEPGALLPWWPTAREEVSAAPGRLAPGKPGGSPSSNRLERPGWPRSPLSGVGLRGWGREAGGAGVLLSCIFSRLQRRNFVAGSGAGAAAPQRLPELRVGQESRLRPGKSLGHGWGRGDSSLSSPVTYCRAGLVCLGREIPSFPPGPSPALRLLERQAMGVT